MAKVLLVLTRTSTAQYKRTEVNLPSYNVLLDGEKIGVVERRMVTRERRGQGMRYVYARWQSPGWVYSTGPGRSLDCYSRRDGVERVLKTHGVEWSEAQDLAKSAKALRF